MATGGRIPGELFTDFVPGNIGKKNVSTERKIVDYRVASGYKDEIPRTVKDLLEMGWELYGFPHIEKSYIFQPMVKYSDD